jgi:hypothetical protein
MQTWHTVVSNSSYPVIIYSDVRVNCYYASLTFIFNGVSSGSNNIDIGFAAYDRTNHTLSNQIMFTFDSNNTIHCKIGNTTSGTWNFDEGTFKIEIINGIAYFYNGLDILDKFVVDSSINRNIVGYFPAIGTWDVEGINYIRATINQYTSLIGGVNISNPTNGQVLKFNGTNWVNDTDNTSSGGGGSTVSLPSGDITLSTTA